MFFESQVYNALYNLIPEKTYFNIGNENIVNQVEDNKEIKWNKNNEVIDKIKRLSELKEEGILTETEFKDKKKELLFKI